MSPQWFQGTAQLAHGAENRLLARADVQRKGLGYGFERLAFVMTHDERGALERRHARQLVLDLAANLATERSFIAYLRGRANLAPVQPSTSMPNYPATSLSDAQARDIYAHIRTFRSAPPSVDKIGTMQQILDAAKRPYKP